MNTIIIGLILIIILISLMAAIIINGYKKAFIFSKLEKRIYTIGMGLCLISTLIFIFIG